MTYINIFKKILINKVYNYIIYYDYKLLYVILII